MNSIHLQEFLPPQEGSSVALGFFDGVHRGHQALLQRARALADKNGSQPVVFTFRNHPASVVSSARSPQLITEFNERCQLLMEAGLDVVWTDFDRPFSQMEPADFIQEILVGRLRAQSVVSGDNYRFGHKAAGNPGLLREDGRFTTEVVADVLEEDQIISSSRIRRCLLEGQVAQAHQLLGRPFRVSGRVLRGDQLGRQLSFPTANLTLGPDKIVPAFGVYAVRVTRKGNSYPAAANLGVRPTVTQEQKHPTLEVHLLDFSDDLYGESLHVDFVERIRGEQRFAGLEALKEQIHKDVERTRQLLA